MTNGSLLDLRKIRTLHRDCAIDRMEITIDGPPDFHNSSRRLKGGWDSFDRITGAVRAALDEPDLEGLTFTIRTNVGPHNAPLHADFVAAMQEAGLAHPRVLFYPAMIHPWGNDISRFELERRAFAELEVSWLRSYTDGGLRTALLPTSTREITCVAVTRRSEVIDPDGKVFSCTEQPLVPGYESAGLGDVESLPSLTTRPAGAFDDWYDNLAEGRETPCHGCHILPVCGGACPKLWREGHPPCPPLKFNLGARLDLYAETLGLTPVATNP